MAADMAKIQANLRHMMAHESKPNPRAMSPTAVTRGFEKEAYPKIVRELRSPELIIKQKSLLAARELLAASTGMVQCIAAGITPALRDLLEDADDTVRERAAGTLQHLATRELGCRDMIQHGCIAQLVQRLADPVTAVRDEAYATLVEAARFDCTRNALIMLGRALPLLVELILQEVPSRAVAGLKLLNACVQVRGNQHALEQLIDKASIIPSIPSLIAANKPPQIKQEAAQLLGVLCSRDDAKQQAVQESCVPKLLDLAAERSDALACAATTALMAITLARDGKYAVINTTNGISELCELLDPAVQQLCINAMVCIANIAEAPEARPVLQQSGAMQVLQRIHDNPTACELVKRSAAQALRQCNFSCRPFDVLPGRDLKDALSGRATPVAAPVL